jgi:hypothetical protein
MDLSQSPASLSIELLSYTASSPCPTIFGFRRNSVYNMPRFVEKTLGTRAVVLLASARGTLLVSRSVLLLRYLHANTVSVCVPCAGSGRSHAPRLQDCRSRYSQNVLWYTGRMRWPSKEFMDTDRMLGHQGLNCNWARRVRYWYAGFKASPPFEFVASESRRQVSFAMFQFAPIRHVLW